jgi:MFS family permease
MQTGSAKTLAVVTAIFFFASSLSGSFLTVYYHEELHMSIPQIIEILVFTFPTIGFLPLILLRTVRSFERIIAVGIFFTMVFYIVLIFAKDPLSLGIMYGIGVATFWPSFNLLQFRLGGSGMRARTLSIFSVVIPSLTSIAGPAVGGFTIERFGFTTLFALTIMLYVVAFFLSLRMRFQPEVHAFSIPRSRAFALFFATFIILGFSESYWIAHPLFVKGISETFINMGTVLASSAIMISIVTFLVNWLSDIKKARVSFAILGTLLNTIWYFALTFVTKSYELVALSLLSGMGSAFSLSWFAHYGDSFGKEHYASILVLMEVGLMIGRLSNLAPAYVFVTSGDFRSYFTLVGVVLFSMIPLFVASKKQSRHT